MNHKHADIADLKDRFLEIKDRLPLDWKEVLIKEFPEYNTIRWGITCAMCLQIYCAGWRD
jgi:hypothetical protein